MKGPRRALNNHGCAHRNISPILTTEQIEQGDLSLPLFYLLDGVSQTLPGDCLVERVNPIP